MSDETVTLSFARNPQDIEHSLNTFNASCRENYELARSLLRTTSYWVYDPSRGSFGPSKFVGFKAMSFPKYRMARREQWEGDRFSGYDTRRAIEECLGDYTQDTALSTRLMEWGEGLLGSGVLDDIDGNKWRFVSL